MKNLLFKKGEFKLLWPFYLDALLSPMFFFLPIFLIVYFQDLGFSLFQIGVLLATPQFASLLFEIPTGAVADLYGRKFSVLFGTLFSGGAILAYYFATGFWTFFIISFLAGFFNTFTSGAFEAWVTELVGKKREKILHSYFAKSLSLDSTGLIVSGLLGVVLVGIFGLKVIFLVGCISYFLSFIILSFAKEKFIRRKSHIKKAYHDLKKQVRKALAYSYNHHVIYYFLVASGVFAFAASFAGLLSWTPLLRDLGFPDHAFGYLWSATATIGALAPLVAHKLHKKGKERNFIVSYFIFWIFFALLILIVKNIFVAIALLLVMEFFDYGRRPTERIYFQRFLPNRLRASIGSVESMFISLVFIIAIPVAGYVVDLIGPHYTIFLSGILAMPAVGIYLKIKEKK